MRHPLATFLKAIPAVVAGILVVSIGTSLAYNNLSTTGNAVSTVGGIPTLAAVTAVGASTVTPLSFDNFTANNVVASSSIRVGKQAATTTIQAQTNAPASGKGTCLAMTDTNGTQYWYSSIAGVLTASTASCE